MRKLDKGLIPAALAAILLLFAAPGCFAEDWPRRAVHLVVPIGVGSAPDVAARLFAERLAARWGQPVVVVNRPGADGLVGVTAFAASHDDHTLLFSPAAPMSVFPLTQPGLPYDAASDFVPICSAIDTYGAIAITGSLHADSLAELEALARGRRGGLNWASGGGAFPLLVAAFAAASGVEMTQVSYREQSQALHDLAEGRIDIVATTLTPLLPLAQSGRIRILAVTNSSRAAIAPRVPTAIESGHPELHFEGLVGFFGGRGMPASRRDRIADDIRAVADAPFRERLATAGQAVRTGRPEEFARDIEAQRVALGALARAAEGRR